MTTYQSLLQESLGTPYVQRTAESRTRFALANLAALMNAEQNARRPCYWERDFTSTFQPAVELGLVSLGPREVGVGGRSARFFHPTPKGQEMYKKLKEEGYDFAPPEGARSPCVD